MEMFVNESHKEFFLNSSYYIISYGGAGSGKSYSAIQKEIIKALQAKHKTLFLRKVARTLKLSVYELILEVLSSLELVEGEDFTTNKTSLSFLFTSTGSSFVMEGLDNVEKLKSISGITRILIEEASEIEEADFNQVDLRLRGDNLEDPQITLLLNPISVNHWIKKRLIDKPSEKVSVFHSTYLDNSRLDAAYGEKLNALKEEDVDYYNIYCLGLWGNPTKRLIFTKFSVITEREFNAIPAELFAGLDFGFVHATAFLLLKYYEGKVYVHEL